MSEALVGGPVRDPAYFMYIGNKEKFLNYLVNKRRFGSSYLSHSEKREVLVKAIRPEGETAVLDLNVLASLVEHSRAHMDIVFMWTEDWPDGNAIVLNPDDRDARFNIQIDTEDPLDRKQCIRLSQIFRSCPVDTMYISAGGDIDGLEIPVGGSRIYFGNDQTGYVDFFLKDLKITGLGKRSAGTHYIVLRGLGGFEPSSLEIPSNKTEVHLDYGLQEQAFEEFLMRMGHMEGDDFEIRPWKSTTGMAQSYIPKDDPLVEYLDSLYPWADRTSVTQIVVHEVADTPFEPANRGRIKLWDGKEVAKIYSVSLKKNAGDWFVAYIES